MPTKIEWAEETWNPVTGCSPKSEGCRNCYAERMARRLAGRYGYPAAPHHFDVTLRSNRLEQPLHWKKPRTIFVCSMGDLFHEDVPFAFVESVFNVMAATPQHTYMVLTKRPARMLRYYDWYTSLPWGVVWPEKNAWLGVTVENQKAADERREPFQATPGAVKFVSYEPALGPVDWTGWEFIDLLIWGGESGHGARPAHHDWFRNARDWAEEHGVARFFKSWGAFRPAEPGDRIDYLFEHDWCGNDLPVPMTRVGKKQTGRLLDGKEHNEMPRR